jgi:flagellum-specific ATP synthase
MPLLDQRFDEALAAIRPTVFGSISAVEGLRIEIAGLSGVARVGDRVRIARRAMQPVMAEIIGLRDGAAIGYAFGAPDGVVAGARADLDASAQFASPSHEWLGFALDWRGVAHGAVAPPGTGPIRRPLAAPPPPARTRRALGPRLDTGFAAFDTMLPLCRGQRIGVFAGSGVGKSMLLGGLAKSFDCDVAVIGLIGERGREVRHFIDEVLGDSGMRRSVVIASTSDEPALVKRQAARLAMTVAEHFRDEGRHVLLIIDSLTRYAEAHREIALAGGEPPSLHAYPPSTIGAIASLVERAGPGSAGAGDITGVFSVLVAGSDMEEPVADMTRGLLDGHVVLERAIAERGRFPAIDIRRSVSRSLPAAASDGENALIADARSIIAAYEDSETIVRAGLYTPGADARTDRALKIWPRLDAFLTIQDSPSATESFAALGAALKD